MYLLTTWYWELLLSWTRTIQKYLGYCPQICYSLSSKTLAQFLQRQQFTPSLCKVLEGFFLLLYHAVSPYYNDLLLSHVSMDFANCLIIFDNFYLLCSIEKCLTLGTLDSFVQEKYYSSSWIYFMNWPCSRNLKSPFYFKRQQCGWQDVSKTYKNRYKGTIPRWLFHS